MTHYLEFDGINVEKAIEKACKDLNLKKEEIQHEIISYGSSGIFGLVGTKKAKIRVAVQNIEKEISHSDFNVSEEKLSGALIGDERKENGYVDKGLYILKKILDTITDGAKTSVRIEGKEICFDIDCSNPAVIIGKKGQTLDAIQYIIEKAVNKSNDEKYNITVDVCGYLDKRHSKLRTLAEKIAEKSKTNGQPMSLGQMNASDRRVIHLALKNDSDVKTHSVGEGFMKKVVIYPRRKGRRSGLPKLYVE